MRKYYFLLILIFVLLIALLYVLVMGSIKTDTYFPESVDRVVSLII